MSDIKKHMPMHKFYLWYHSQDWINEGPTVEGLNREDRIAHAKDRGEAATQEAQNRSLYSALWRA